MNGSVELSWTCQLHFVHRMQAMQDAFRVVLACLRHPAIITFRAWFEGAESWCHRIIADTLNYGTLQNSLSHSGQYHAVHFCFFLYIDKLGKMCMIWHIDAHEQLRQLRWATAFSPLLPGPVSAWIVMDLCSAGSVESFVRREARG